MARETFLLGEFLRVLVSIDRKLEGILHPRREVQAIEEEIRRLKEASKELQTAINKSKLV